MTVNVSKPRQIAYVDQVCNPNLLDNADFKINQRGQITYTPPESGAIYACDRWCVIGGAVTFGDNGATFTDGVIDFYQNSLDYNLADWQGKDFTMSINLDGVIYYDTVKNCDTFTLSSGYNFVFGDSGWVGAVIFNWWKTNSLLVAVKPSGHNGSLKKVKFELGDISTLHLDPSVNPAVELLKCQRYLFNASVANPQGNTALGSGYVYKNGNAYITMPLCVTMRVRPTLLIDGALYISDGVVSVAVPPENIALHDNCAANATLMISPPEGVAFTKGNACMLWSNRSIVKALLSAEL